MARENQSILRKRAARMGAVQGVYQALVCGEPIRPAKRADKIITQWQSETTKEDPEWHADVVPESALLLKILEGVEAHHVALDEKIGASLQEGWKLSRLSTITHALLRAAIYELLYHTQLKEGIIVDEYVSMAAEFVEPKDVDFIHATLRSLAGEVRTAS